MDCHHSASPEVIERDLKGQVVGDVLFEAWKRSMYVTVPSVYEVLPICVVLPRSTDMSASAGLTQEMKYLNVLDPERSRLIA